MTLQQGGPYASMRRSAGGTLATFTPELLVDALGELGLAARAAGKVIDIAIYGGSCLMLVSNFRVATDDVDAVIEVDRRFLMEAAAELASRRGWPTDWLNDGVRTFLSPRVEPFNDHLFFRAFPSEQAPGLRVFVPTPEYLLAMKLLSLRIDPATDDSDLADILNLLAIVGLRSKEEIVAFAAGFYPEARVSGRLRLALDRIWREHEAMREDTSHAPPVYLGRGRAPR